ncbi:MAG: hypothetical protein MI725_16410 [Pirellulales bacterium]|nr:hypothetical protein [Pirellulales bacterium]
MRSIRFQNAASVRFQGILALALVLSTTTAAEARLFWQTYGSTIPTAAGCGCTWNWRQDYFAPRHASSCRYDLFGCGKTSRTTSPACKWRHPLYPGYCGIYGPLHYCCRDRVYRCRCGCTPLRPDFNCGCRESCRVPLRPRHCGSCSGCGPTCCCPGVMAAAESSPLPNVEAPGLQVLGSIPVGGNELLAGDELSLLAEELSEDKKILIGPGTIVPGKSLPSLGRPQQDNLTQP